MQIDMHYYGVFAIARSAGLTREAARIIATASQFVDDNAQTNGMEFPSAATMSTEPTAHHTTSVKNIDGESQRKVWVPFHFLPGNEGESFTERLVCRQDSKIARALRAHHLSLSDKAFYLELVGVLAHVYADTFSHYGFSGVSSRTNKVVNDSFEYRDLEPEIEAYIEKKKQRFFEKYGTGLVRNIKSFLAEAASGALGHGAAVTLPDRPYLSWRFMYENGEDSGWRDNPATFLEACKQLHAVFKLVAAQRPDLADVKQQREWADLEETVKAILATQGDKQTRIQAWQAACANGDILTIAETIPDYVDWNAGFEHINESTAPEEMMSLPSYRFYQAASYHRWYVLRELLPSYDLMVV
ncbi:hypothetical protein L4D15_23200 [Enterovibrio norvegicus]|uniref:DUF6765 family protein n=1 Tax=Enterovibrio norvegicus TaxID=188144 RepID=UPI003D0FDBDB